MHYSLNSMPYSPDSGRTCLTRAMFCSRRLRREERHGGQGSPSCTVGTVVGKLAAGLEEDGGGDPGAELVRWDWERGTLSAGGRRPARVWGKTGGRLARMDRIPATSMIVLGGACGRRGWFSRQERGMRREEIRRRRVGEDESGGLLFWLVYMSSGRPLGVRAPARQYILYVGPAHSMLEWSSPAQAIEHGFNRAAKTPRTLLEIASNTGRPNWLPALPSRRRRRRRRATSVLDYIPPAACMPTCNRCLPAWLTPPVRQPCEIYFA
jgi:hypothetical protein